MNSKHKIVAEAVEDLMQLSAEEILEEMKKIPEDHFLNSLVDLYGNDYSFGMTEEDVLTEERNNI